jgi:AraC family L-rhamnose operon transcriptional activator RhaR
MRLLEADLARDWTLTGLAAELHLASGYLVRLFNAATSLPEPVTASTQRPSGASTAGPSHYGRNCCPTSA